MIDIIKQESEDKEAKLEMFGEGRWIDEPDLVEFVFKSYTCFISRNEGGSLCGYVEIPEGHPWEGKHYRDIDCECHCGLTFCNDQPENTLLDGLLVYEALRRKENEPFIIGFDCAHSCDIVPACEKTLQIVEQNMKEKYPYKHETFFNLFLRTYKDINYVIEECKSIVDQAIEAANGTE